MKLRCCVCDKEIKPGEHVAIAFDGSAIVHLDRCTYLVPHRTLNEREKLYAFRALKFAGEKGV